MSALVQAPHGPHRPRPPPTPPLPYDLPIDAIAEYRAASAANDIDRLLETLAPDATLTSPLISRGAVQGKDDLRLLLGAVYGTLRRLHWHREIRDANTCVVLATAYVGPLKLDDAMVFDLADDGHIQRITPHLRPWLATTAFAFVLLPQVGRHPGLLWRALRSS